MIKEYNYINIREVLSRVLRHPLLQDVTIEQAVQYTIDFISIFGMPKLYKDIETTIEIADYKGLLPCDLVSIIQVREHNKHIMLRSMTSNFNTNGIETKRATGTEWSFKTQGRIIFTSFKDGEVDIAYRSMPIDKDGLPLLIDNSVFLKCLELYIKKEVFTILFDLGKITGQVLQNTQQQYAWAAGQLHAEFTIPSVSEMESITRMWTSLIQDNNIFKDGFASLGTNRTVKAH